MLPIRWLLPCVLTALAGTLLLVAAAPGAAADETPAPPADGSGEPASSPEPPFWSIEYIMPDGDATPEGWEVAQGRPPAGAPTAAAITALGKDLGLDDDVFYADGALLKRGEERIALVMADVDEKVQAFRTALDARASEAGWQVRELGHPTRLAVVGGTGESQAAADVVLEYAVYRLSQKAMDRLNGRGHQDAASHEAAQAYAAAIRAIAPKAGIAHYIDATRLGFEATKGGKKDAAIEAQATEAYGRAIAAGVPYPPAGFRLVVAAQNFGGGLLTGKDKTRLPEALRALELAVEHETDARGNQERYTNRYNLACAYVRAKRIDDAFDMLKKSMETGKTLPPFTWRKSYEHMSEKDEDMAPLKSDPRFDELLAEYAPPPEKKPHAK